MHLLYQLLHNRFLTGSLCCYCHPTFSAFPSWLRRRAFTFKRFTLKASINDGLFTCDDVYHFALVSS